MFWKHLQCSVAEELALFFYSPEEKAVVYKDTNELVSGTHEWHWYGMDFSCV